MVEHCHLARLVSDRPVHHHRCPAICLVLQLVGGDVRPLELEPTGLQQYGIAARAELPDA